MQLDASERRICRGPVYASFLGIGPVTGPISQAQQDLVSEGIENFEYTPLAKSFVMRIAVGMLFLEYEKSNN
jgi:hypothetical protein